MDKITITLTVDNVSHTFRGDYDEMFNKDWNQEVQELIDQTNFEGF